MLTGTIQQTLRCHSMVRTGDRVLVGLSGGPDSVALTHALDELRADLGIDLVIAHFDHQLRDDSAEDVAFCRELARVLDLPFVAGKGAVAARAKEEKRSIEDAARASRYEFLFHQAARQRCRRIAVGHTMDDQAETLLMRLTRGSGLRGLASAYPVTTPADRSPVSSDAPAVIRPLIEIRRQQVMDYLCARGLAHRHDPSNEDRRFTRNRLRHEVIPWMTAELNPRLVETLARSAALLRDEEDFMEGQARQAFSTAATAGAEDVRLSVQALQEAHPALRRRLARLAAERTAGDTRNVTRTHVSDVLGLLAPGKSGREVHLPGIVVERSFDELVFVPKSGRSRRECHDNGYNDFEYRLEIPSKLSIRECRGLLTAHLLEPLRTGDEPGAAAGNAVVVGVEDGISELGVRSPRSSDRFRPLGAPGTKSLARYLMERKVAKRQRGRVPLVVRADDPDEIIWVAGHSISERARLGAGCRGLLLEWIDQ